MTRPRDRHSAKSAFINIRVTPELKAKLEAEASLSGRKLSAECEDRLTRTMGADEAPQSSDATKRLLRDIEAQIQAIEIGTQKSWETDLPTWVAVADMLGEGPINASPPNGVAALDRKFLAVVSDLAGLLVRRHAILSGLSVIGLQSGPFDKPDDVSAALDQLSLPNEMRVRADQQLEEIQGIDESERELTSRLDELITPVIEAVEEGRQLYEKMPKAPTLRWAFTKLEEANGPLGRLALGLPSVVVPQNTLASNLGGLFRARSGTTLGDYIKSKSALSGEGNDPTS